MTPISNAGKHALRKNALRRALTAREPAGPGADVDESFMGIVSWSTALCSGAMLASIQSLYKDAAGFAFHITPATVAAFVIGTAVVLTYWRVAPMSLLIRRLSSLVLVFAGAAAFLYPLRFLPGEKMHDLFQGLAAAAVALSLGAFFLWRLKRFFERDAAISEMETKDRD